MSPQAAGTYCFNSSMVQLKVILFSGDDFLKDGFNSFMVQLKETLRINP